MLARDSLVLFQVFGAPVRTSRKMVGRLSARRISRGTKRIDACHVVGVMQATRRAEEEDSRLAEEKGRRRLEAGGRPDADGMGIERSRRWRLAQGKVDGVDGW